MKNGRQKYQKWLREQTSSTKRFFIVPVRLKKRGDEVRIFVAKKRR